MEKFYCVSVSITRLGGKEQVANYYYKSLDKANGHIGGYRAYNGYHVVKETENTLLVRNDSWTEIFLELTECYFED